MKTKSGLVVVILLAACFARAQTNNLTALLQQGLFEEQASRNLDAAITDYQTLAAQFDKDRQLAATAVFRLGECYRAQGKTNEAAAQYQRILQDFSDQSTLVTLSRQDLAGMGLAKTDSPTTAAPTTENADAQLLKKLGGRSQDDLEKLLPTLMPNATLDTLIKERDEVKIQRAKLLVDYASDNIQVTRLDAELKSLDQQIEDTISGMMQALKLRAEISRPSTPKLDLVDLSIPVTSEEDQEIARLQQILQNSPDLINAASFRENRMETPLVQAVRRDWPRAVKFLLDNGANLDGAALIAAADQGHKAMVELLLERGADVNARNSRHVGGDDGTALHVAAQNGFLSVAEILIQHKADVDAVNNEEQTPLHRAAIKGWPAMVTLLLSKGADVNARDRNGITPLGEAVAAKQADIVTKLLKAGAKPDNEDADGRTALDYAAQHGDVDLIKILLAAGADPNAGKNSSIIFDGLARPQTMKLLLAGGARPNIRADKGTTPLLSAIESGQSESAALLIQNGADVNAVNDNGMTPLQMAVWAQNISMVSLLLSNKVDINARHPAGRTALNMSVEAEHGYRPYHAGDYGGSSTSPDVDIARKMSALLRAHGALDNLPYWDRIVLSRPESGFTQEIYRKNTNDWNHFTLLEFIYGALASQSQNIPFPDFKHVVVARPGTNGAPVRRMEVDLLDATNHIVFEKDIPLEFGDVVEISERGHTLAERDNLLNDQYQSIASHLKTGQAQLVAAGSQPVMLSLSAFPTDEAYIGVAVKSQAAENVLTSSSDLAHVKLTRHDPKTGKTHEWVMDCSNAGHSPYWGPELLVRDGDMIEVPQKQ